MNHFHSLCILLVCFVVVSCQNPSTRKTSGPQSQNYDEILKKGRMASEATQKTLLQNVGTAMKEGGPVHAISFCNVKAMPLKDSLSRELHADISRISFKYRNPQDKPAGEMDEFILKHFESIQNPSLPMDTVIFSDDAAIYYKAIFIGMETCLKCHGTPTKDISPETKQKITELYPDDRATGFSLHDFRGAWKIIFE